MTEIQTLPVYLTKRRTLTRQSAVLKKPEQHQLPDPVIDAADRREWQRQWKLIMAESHVFFDGIDDASIDKVKPLLSKIGTNVELFFGSKVSHVVTRRPVDANYPPSDLLSKAKQLAIKIWSYDKLVRFLTNLLGQAPRNPADGQHTNLSRMLREEKLVGPNDRDPHTKREDYHYFKGPYLLVWDPTYHYRPFMAKEYPKVDDTSEGDWPRFKTSSSGRCPFLADSPRMIAERRALEGVRRKRRSPLIDESTPNKVVILEHEGAAVAMTPERSLTTAVEEAMTPATPATPVTPDIVLRHRFSETIASGVNMSTMTSAVQSVAKSGTDNQSGQLGNGLNPVLAQVPSREISKLKTKILTREAKLFMPKPMVALADAKGSNTPATGSTPSKSQQTTPRAATSKELRPGFCENCHEQFDNFNTHIESKKHRRYAQEVKHFTKLDELLDKLQRKPGRKAGNLTVTSSEHM